MRVRSVVSLLMANAILFSPVDAAAQPIASQSQQPPLTFHGYAVLNHADGISLDTIADNVTQTPKRGEDWYADLAAGAQFQKRLGVSSGILFVYDITYREYNINHDYNQLSNKVTLETIFVAGPFGHTVGIYADVAHLGDDISHYSDTYGFNWNITKPIAKQTDLSLALSTWNMDYINATSTDGIGGKAAASLSYRPKERPYSFVLKADYSHFEAEAATYCYDLVGASLAVNYLLSPKDNLSFSLSGRHFDYEGFDTIQTGLRRDDDILAASLGYRRMLGNKVSVNAAISYQQTNSNIQRFDYDSHRVSLGIRKNF